MQCTADAVHISPPIRITSLFTTSYKPDAKRWKVGEDRPLRPRAKSAWRASNVVSGSPVTAERKLPVENSPNSPRTETSITAMLKIVTAIPLNDLPASLTWKLSPTGVTWNWVTQLMLSTTDSSISGALNAVQQDVLQALVAGQSISAAANAVGIHRSTVHNWTRQNPAFARALLEAHHHRAERMLDELGDLADLAIDTFRQLLSDEKAPASVRLKAAMEIAKLVESQRPTLRETTLTEVKCDRLDADLQLHRVAAMSATVSPPPPPAHFANVGRNAPCPCGSSLKHKRCCGNPVTARAA